MARTVRDTLLETRAARLRLSPRSKPYWRSIETGLHVGYRRLRQGGGTWVARRFCGNGRYCERQLGNSDDLQDADGTSILSFRQAQESARAWWKLEQRRALGLEAEQRGPYSVRMALEDYVKNYIGRGGRDLTNVRSIIDSHILPSLGPLDTARLTTKRIREWHHSLATSPRLTRRGTKEKDVSTPPAFLDSEAVRRRRARANRVLTVLKAALNHGFAEHLIPSDQAWRRVAPFRGVETARARYLSFTECQRLITASSPDFRPLVRAAILTGARYGELIRLTVGDVNLESATIHIRESKSGTPRHVPLTEEVLEHFEQWVAGRARSETVFRRADGRSWKRSEQARPLAAACERAAITPPITFHGLRDTFASVLAMNGAPMAVIARVLGHADTRITEKHYAHLAPNYVAESLRAHFPRLNSAREGRQTLLTMRPAR
jgi:integrase